MAARRFIVMAKEEYMKGIPYGVPDFVTVRDGGCYYVDKTRFIPELEKQCYQMFLRPPQPNATDNV